MNSIPELQEVIRRSSKVHVHGAKTKQALHQGDAEATPISTQVLTGVVTYDPQEFVITLMSGTPVQEVVALLAEQGQYLPFDPLFAKRGATIGGTIASNTSGPGRFRFGGIRDFVLGVRFIDGNGNCIRGGGQVVKNAAGFDYPKLMVGSQGKLGLIYEVTLKVFPRPQTTATILGLFPDLESALGAMNDLACSPADIESLDLLPRCNWEAVRSSSDHDVNHVSHRVTQADPSIGYELAIRIAGLECAIPKRLQRLQELLPAHHVLTEEQDTKFWSNASNMDWVSPESTLTKLAVTPNAIAALEAKLQALSVPRRYSVGGNVAWIAMPWTTEWISQFGPGAMLLNPPSSSPSISQSRSPSSSSQRTTELPGPFGRAIQRALDPQSKFV